jgi:anti-sigma regulatory factor (Ser/Thr protein kinase)
VSTLAAERLVLRNDLAELERLAGWIEGWRQQDVSPDISLAIQLCLEEAVANIIMYGGEKDDPLEIAVELECNGGTLVARIEDTGRRFDPTRVAPPSVARSLEEAKVGGLGIHLMRSFATGIRYEHHDGHNLLTLRFAESRGRNISQGERHDGGVRVRTIPIAGRTA